MITKLSRSIIARILYVILFVQFVGAVPVLHPFPSQWLPCLLPLEVVQDFLPQLLNQGVVRYQDKLL